MYRWLTIIGGNRKLWSYFGEYFVKCSSRFFFSLADDTKPPLPPTLEPTGPAPSLSELDSLQDPPTLKPISESKSLNRLHKRLKSEGELFDKKTLQRESHHAFQRLLSDNGLNGLALQATGTSASPPFSGVGRRTSVLFKKAKNGVKLQRDLDCPLENGEDHGQSGQLSPSSIEGEQPSRKEPQSGSCSGSDDEKSPRQAGVTGDSPELSFLWCFGKSEISRVRVLAGWLAGKKCPHLYTVQHFPESLWSLGSV